MTSLIPVWVVLAQSATNNEHVCRVFTTEENAEKEAETLRHIFWPSVRVFHARMVAQPSRNTGEALGIIRLL